MLNTAFKIWSGVISPLYFPLFPWIPALAFPVALQLSFLCICRSKLSTDSRNPQSLLFPVDRFEGSGQFPCTQKPSECLNLFLSGAISWLCSAHWAQSGKPLLLLWTWIFFTFLSDVRTVTADLFAASCQLLFFPSGNGFVRQLALQVFTSRLLVSSISANSVGTSLCNHL